MKQLVLLFLMMSFGAFAQDIKLMKASMQTINSGAAPVSTTNYKVELKKEKQCKWSIDSVISINTGQPVKYTVVKVDDPGATSPRYEQVRSYQKTDLGNYQISFGVTKQRGGRPGGPQNLKADTTNIEGGVIIYYRIKKRRKQLKIIEFEKLETIDAP